MAILMTFLKQNWFKLGLLVAVLITATTLYQSLVIIPKERDMQKQSQEAQQQLIDNQRQTETKKQLQACLNKIDLDDKAFWDSGQLGYTLAEKQNLKDNCFKQYR